MSNDPFSVESGETGVVRVFSVLDAETAQALGSGELPLAPVLGIDRIDRDHVELFPLEDLEGVGLITYLVDGQGIPETALTGDRDMLEGLEGHVLILRSSAFNRMRVRLSPGPELSFVAAYSEDRPDFRPERIPSEAARPYSTPQTPDRDSRARLWRVGSAVSGVLIVLVLLLVWWVLS